MITETSSTITYHVPYTPDFSQLMLSYWPIPYAIYRKSETLFYSKVHFVLNWLIVLQAVIKIFYGYVVDTCRVRDQVLEFCVSNGRSLVAQTTHEDRHETIENSTSSEKCAVV